MKLTRFNKLSVLKRISRPLLDQFFHRFSRVLQGSEGSSDRNLKGPLLALPPPDAGEDEYYNGIARILNHPDKLPDCLNEALFALEDVAHPGAEDLLRSLPGWLEFAERLKVDSTCEEVALQLWLHDPASLIRASNTHRLKRLTAFEHAGRSPAFPVPAAVIQSADNILTALASGLDAWFALNDRGEDTAKVEVYSLGGEFWFLIQHGDRYSRAPAVHSRKTEIIHFRPERDDVVVYSTDLDEIRINARTKGERDLYIRQFGLHLRGSEDYFTRLPTYTLDPLRTRGVDALDPAGFDAIQSVKLRELEIWYDEHRTITRSPRCLFEMAAAQGQGSPIPQDGELRRAIFEIQFTGASRPRPVEIRLPNTLKLGRRCDARLIQSYLKRQEFRRPCRHGGPGGD